MTVKAKKHLGQHFLTDENIAKKIVDALQNHTETTLEVGPGTGILTKYLLQKNTPLFLAEIDQESIQYLIKNYDIGTEKFIGDFLKTNFQFTTKQINIIGNFPYNISSQIIFNIIDNYQRIPQVVGMFQKEVAERIAAKPSTKAYGIISVLTQAIYDVEYLFTVNENVFNPPPKVKSGVIRMTRNPKKHATEYKTILTKIVKAGFNQRRKKLSNALKAINIPTHIQNHQFLNKRAEELTVENFITLAIEWSKTTH